MIKPAIWMRNRLYESYCRLDITVLVLGLLVTVSGVLLAHIWDNEQRTDAFYADADIRGIEIQQQLNRLVADVQAVAQFYDASESVTAGEFERFARPFIERHPIIRALSWAMRITAAERGTFEAQQRVDGVTDFAVHQFATAAPQSDLFPITRIVPLAKNAPALGFDLGSETHRRAALEQAINTGQPAATAPLELVQETADQRSLLVLVPVFHAGDERTRHTLRGLAVGALRLGELVEEVLKALPPQPIDLVLRDPSAAGDAGVLHVHSAHPQSVTRHTLHRCLTAAFRHEIPLTIAGRQLTLAAAPAMGAYPRSWWPPALLLIGLTLNAALFFLLRHDRRTTAQLFEREERLQLFITHAPIALALFDRDMRYVVASRRWCQDYGLSDCDLTGQSHYAIFPEIPDRWRVAHQRGLAGEELRADAEPFERANGTVQWSRWKLCPWRDGDGQIAGIAIFTENVTAQRAAEVALEISEERLRLALDAAQLGIFDWDIATDHIVWSAQHERLWGFAVGEFDGSYAAFSSRVHPDDLARVNANHNRSMTDRSHLAQEFRVVWPDGSVHWIAGYGEFTFDAAGQATRMRGVVMDITPRREMEEALREREHWLAESQRIAHIGSWVHELDGRIIWSDEVYRMWQLSPASFTPTAENFLQLLHLNDRPVMQAWIEDCWAGLSPDNFVYRILRADGEIRYLSGGGELQCDAHGQPLRMAGTVLDVTDMTQAYTILRDQQERLEEALALAQLAHIDSLTGLTNRAGFTEQLARIHATAQRHSHRFALINLDLDGFKGINDAFGHQMGDQVLRDVAMCLVENCRPEDCAGRYGGDEFALLLNDAPDAGAAVTVAERIRDRIAIMRWQGYGVSASVGVALFPDHATELDQLIHLADVAMYAAKAAGKNRVILARFI
ncbi:diguanylate cyclase [Thiospirillum jenense]|uniref:Diguanylate cyclase n=1 Tax=Thiospirillum jenense TaxID=1653858 RepID=A0A839H6S1_9GAMM|nr:diguanylate cyclase [Thiospirillum jenense]MBB1125423.1 diguanylate cyclase [Thiospirillum jenense]